MNPDDLKLILANQVSIMSALVSLLPSDDVAVWRRELVYQVGATMDRIKRIEKDGR